MQLYFAMLTIKLNFCTTYKCSTHHCIFINVHHILDNIIPFTFLAFLIIKIVLTISYHSCWSLKIDGAVTKISFSINFEKIIFNFCQKTTLVLASMLSGLSFEHPALQRPISHCCRPEFFIHFDFLIGRPVSP